MRKLSTSWTNAGSRMISQIECAYDQQLHATTDHRNGIYVCIRTICQGSEGSAYWVLAGKKPNFRATFEQDCLLKPCEKRKGASGLDRKSDGEGSEDEKTDEDI